MAGSASADGHSRSSQATVNKKDWIGFFFVVTISAVLAYNYFLEVDLQLLDYRLQIHNEVLDSSAVTPYRYRILMPFLCNFLFRLNAIILPEDIAFLFSYWFCQLSAILLFIALMYRYLNLWFPRIYALVGILFIGGMMPIALKDHFYAPWSLLEPALFTLALLLMVRKRTILLGVIVAIATLNRETALFIPILFFLTTADLQDAILQRRSIPRQQLLFFTIYLAIWLVVFVGMRLILGSGPPAITLSETVERNFSLGGILKTSVNGLLFMGAYWLFAALGYKYADRFVQRSALIVPLFLIPVAIWGLWYEVRLLMPLYPILIPLGLSFLQAMWDGHDRPQVQGI